MTGLYRVFDAATPPETPPPGVQGVLGYIGGQRATRTWTLDDWLRFKDLKQYPGYVPDFTAQKPGPAADEACQLMRNLGWAPYQPGRRALICDLETLNERAWYAMFAGHVFNAGFTAVAYGSLSTVLENAAEDVIVAAWDGNPALVPGQTIHGHQHTANVPFGGTVVDFSAFDDWLWARGGQGPRHA
jgi:hypothetical protein